MSAGTFDSLDLGSIDSPGFTAVSDSTDAASGSDGATQGFLQNLKNLPGDLLGAITPTGNGGGIITDAEVTAQNVANSVGQAVAAAANASATVANDITDITLVSMVVGGIVLTAIAVAYVYTLYKEG
jgi:hypothetical protein